MTPISVKMPMLMLVFSSVISVMTILVVCTDHWVRIVYNSEEEFMGLFYSDKNSPLILNCNDNTSQTSCTYLVAARYAGVLAGADSLLTAYGYYLISINFSLYSVPGLFWMMVGCNGLIQSLLTMLCVIFYYLFTSTHLTQNDDINVEYTAHDAITTTDLGWSYWALFIMALISSVLTIFNFCVELECFRQSVLAATPHKGTTLKYKLVKQHNGV